MSEEINISVIIPTYNRAKVLPRAIHSALNQTSPPFEVIVVDDGSTDNTYEVLSRFGDDIICIQQENGGPAKARNRGIENSTGNWIAFLDSDDEWLPEKLEKQVDLLKNTGGNVAISNSVYFDIPDSSITTFSKARFSDLLFESDGSLLDCFSLLVEQNFIHLSSVIVNKSCLDSTGYFDETMKVAEDTDLWLRLSNQNLFGIISEPLAQRDTLPDKLSGNKEKEYRGRIYLFNKFLHNSEDLPDSKRKEIIARRNFINGRLVGLKLHFTGIGSALNTLLRLNLTSLFSKQFYKGYLWNRKEARNAQIGVNDAR